MGPRRAWIGGAVAAPLVTLLALGCGRRGGAESETESSAHPTVRVAPVVTHVFRGAIEAPGEWKAANETEIHAPFEAIVESVTVRPGEAVSRGATLGWWTTYESEAAIRGAELMRAQARDSVATAEATKAMRDAKAAAVRVPIVSPITGTVLRRQVDDGARLAAGAEAFALVSGDAVVFEARIPPERRSEVKVGAAASIVEPGSPDRAAHVWTLLPSTGTDQSALVWLRPESRADHPELGRFGTAVILAGAARTALAVPDSAIVEDDLTGRQRIALVDSLARVLWVEVELGPHEGGVRAITSPALHAGARVIVAGQRGLAPGTAVSVAP